MTSDVKPVVVGIDGSDAAIAAALWAVDEAIERNVPLRLVHVTGTPRPSSGPGAANDIASEYGESCLRAASAAVAATGKTVKCETEILWCAVNDGLLTEARAASMLCVASVGIGWVAEKVLGSTATTVSREAACPVVIVRFPQRVASSHPDRWVVVGVDDRPDNNGLLPYALHEARVRGSSLLAVATWSSERSGVPFADLDKRCHKWALSYPDVHIHPAATGGALPEFLLSTSDLAIDLVVISAADADQIPQIIGPHHRPLVPSGQYSVMVVH